MVGLVLVLDDDPPVDGLVFHRRAEIRRDRVLVPSGFIGRFHTMHGTLLRLGGIPSDLYRFIRRNRDQFLLTRLECNMGLDRLFLQGGSSIIGDQYEENRDQFRHGTHCVSLPAPPALRKEGPFLHCIAVGILRRGERAVKERAGGATARRLGAGQRRSSRLTAAYLLSTNRRGRVRARSMAARAERPSQRCTLQAEI